jgi:hypothetical protein
MEVNMSQRNILLMMLASIVAMFGGLVAYDMKVNHRLEKILHKGESKENWKWKDKWTPDSKESKPEKEKEEKPNKPEKPKTQVVASDFQDALDKSQELNMPIFAFFHAGWCGQCTKMEKEFDNPKVKSMLLNYILVKVNSDKDKSTTKKFKVSGLPSYVITNYNADKLKFGSGYKQASDLAQWLDEPDLLNQPNKDDVTPRDEEPQPKPKRKRRKVDDITDSVPSNPNGGCRPGSGCNPNGGCRPGSGCNPNNGGCRPGTGGGSGCNPNGCRPGSGGCPNGGCNPNGGCVPGTGGCNPGGCNPGVWPGTGGCSPRGCNPGCR